VCVCGRGGGGVLGCPLRTSAWVYDTQTQAHTASVKHRYARTHARTIMHPHPPSLVMRKHSNPTKAKHQRTEALEGAAGSLDSHCGCQRQAQLSFQQSDRTENERHQGTAGATLSLAPADRTCVCARTCVCVCVCVRACVCVCVCGSAQ
jgi:hypothetical protein